MKTSNLLSLLLFLFCYSWTTVRAQQLSHFSQYMLNGYLINPALAGSENYGELKTGYRSQWSGVEGAPESFYLTAHTPLGKMNRSNTPTSFPYRERTGSKSLRQNYRTKDVLHALPHHGAGLAIVRDKAGVLQRTDVGLSYAYHLPVSRSLKLSAGMTAGFALYQVDEAALELTNPNDPAFLGSYYNQAKPTIAAGMLLYSERFYAGFASAQLFQDELSRHFWDKGATENDARSRAHHSLMGGYKVYLSPKVSVLPSVLVKYANPAPLTADVNVKLLLDDKLWLGGSYREQESFVALAGINIKNLVQVGYAYDVAATGMSRYGRGSHEVVIGLLLHNRDRVFSPSDFW
ncbi:type IX secretion system membrane protein PorP/SprF [Pontibacter sp. Tf4]|uniref:PorP/SprF family type IX secretion system membrane protein n=1 Tax=Pontibacter sp. Tf4 TaxID=2761620 RepID=UPI00162A0693|nr:type IX secretion system membrane protein PorP/SprF [Pontibacter sp. Tf4]MBB6610917.1 type IX secretion system membrane protein PorP/SprF [Pontibacter sp. Tf4]